MSDEQGTPERDRLAAFVRSIHYYGDPPDSRLQSRVDADVEEVLELARALAPASPSGAPQDPSAGSRRDQLAAYAHDAWSGWMRYLFRCSRREENGDVTIPSDQAARWMRQVATDYRDLPITEQLSDLKEADEMLRIMAAPPVACGCREALERLVKCDGPYNWQTSDGYNSAMRELEYAKVEARVALARCAGEGG